LKKKKHSKKVFVGSMGVDSSFSFDKDSLRMLKLSDHFNALEFFYSRQYKVFTVAEDTLLRSVQFCLAQNLAKTFLELIRAIANTFVPNTIIRVTSGCRNLEVHESVRLAEGRDPRIVSDHSYMYPYFPLGVGAVDFQIPGFSGEWYERTLRAFLEAKDPLNFGQLIYYDLPKVKWVHLSNPRSVLGLPGKVISRLDSAKVLRYNGKRFDSLEFVR
jgi:hypothetical protein